MSVTVTTRPTNGVSYGNKHTVTTAEAADGTIIFDFQNSEDLVCTVLILNSSGVYQVPTDLKIEYSTGKITLSGYSFSAGEVIQLIANTARTD